MRPRGRRGRVRRTPTLPPTSPRRKASPTTRPQAQRATVPEPRSQGCPPWCTRSLPRSRRRCARTSSTCELAARWPSCPDRRSQQLGRREFGASRSAASLIAGPARMKPSLRHSGPVISKRTGRGGRWRVSRMRAATSRPLFSATGPDRPQRRPKASIATPVQRPVRAFDPPLRGHHRRCRPAAPSRRSAEADRWIRGRDGSRASQPVPAAQICHYLSPGGWGRWGVGEQSSVWPVNSRQRSGPTSVTDAAMSAISWRWKPRPEPSAPPAHRARATPLPTGHRRH